MEKTVEKIKNLFIRNDIPVFGITKSSFLDGELAGFRPSNALPSAKSILCLGNPVPKGIFQNNGRQHENYWRAANIYYRNMDAILMQVARIIEEQGEVAVPVFG